MSTPPRRCAAAGEHDCAQPDDETCGPNCLHAVYRYFGEEMGLGTVIDEVRLATPEDVAAAVAAAKEAFVGWSTATPGERSTVLHDLAARMSARAEEYAQAESAQAGKPIRLTREFDVPGSIDNAEFFAGAARHLQGSAAAEWDGTHTSTVRREAIGVVGSIAPWNYPLQMAMWKMLPAVSGLRLASTMARATQSTGITSRRTSPKSG